MSDLRWSLLGADIATHAGSSISLTSRPTSVLASLLLRANKDVSIDVLIGELWGDRPPKTARNSVARFVADIRAALGEHSDRIETRPSGYRVTVREEELDTVRVQWLSNEAERLSQIAPEQALAHIDDAISHFAPAERRPTNTLDRGEQISRTFDEQLVALLERHGDLSLALERHRSLVGELEQRVVDHPYHEHFWAQLMLALYRSGRVRDSLRVYRRVYDSLVEVGVEPSEQLRSLEAQILARTVPPAASPSTQSASDACTTNPADGYHGLNRPKNAFIGRTDDIGTLMEHVRQHRLTTIVGLGGSGKTRLAMELSDLLAPEFEHGACRVGLATATGASAVALQLGRALGVAAADLDPADPVGSVARRLAGQRLLLVLDNCEHVLGAVHDVVTAIIEHTDDIVVLATSREPLHVVAEHTHALAPLALGRPDGESGELSPAAELFIDRAAASTKWPTRTDDQHARIEAICAALGGLPLAIEIAAAQMSHLRPEQLLERLSDDERHTEIGAVLSDVIEWTWMRLDDPQQQTLIALAACPSGLTLEAARAVCETERVKSDLDALLDCGLVRAEAADGSVRFVAHEPVRNDVEKRPDAAARRSAALDRLAAWLHDRLAIWGHAELHCLIEAIDAVDSEQQNLSVVLEHLAAAGRTGDIVWFATAAAGMWNQRGMPLETRRWLEPIDRSQLGASERSAVAASLMDAASSIGDIAGILELATEALDAAGNEAFDFVPHVAGLVGMLGRMFPIDRAPMAYLRMAREVAEQTPSASTNRSLAAMWSATFSLLTREYERAVEGYRRSLVDAEPGRVMHMAETGEAVALFSLGRRDEAYERMLTWRSEATADEFHFHVDLVRAVVLAGVGRFDEARTTLEVSARSTSPASLRGRADDFQIAFGLIAFEQGDRELAEDLVGTVVGRSVMCMALLAEHVGRQRGVTTNEEWRDVAFELMGRAFTPAESGPALFVPELIERWTRSPYLPPA